MRNFNTENEIERNVNYLINDILNNNECHISKKEQILSVIGFYKGYCSAMKWTINSNMVDEWRQNIVETSMI